MQAELVQKQYTVFPVKIRTLAFMPIYDSTLDCLNVSTEPHLLLFRVSLDIYMCF